jgi:hypothetical protein
MSSKKTLKYKYNDFKKQQEQATLDDSNAV